MNFRRGAKPYSLPASQAGVKSLGVQPINTQMAIQSLSSQSNFDLFLLGWAYPTKEPLICFG